MKPMHLLLFFALSLQRSLLAVRGGGEPLPFDLNKSPPPSPQPGVTENINISTIQSNQTGNLNQEADNSQEFTLKGLKRKRLPKRKYNFPPGTSLQEKQKAWSRTFRAKMTPKQEERYKEVAKKRLLRPEVKAERATKSKNRYSNLTEEGKKKHRSIVKEGKIKRLKGMTEEQREQYRLERNIIERDRQRIKRAKLKSN